MLYFKLQSVLFHVLQDVLMAKEIVLECFFFAQIMGRKLASYLPERRSYWGGLLHFLEHITSILPSNWSGDNFSTNQRPFKSEQIQRYKE